MGGINRGNIENSYSAGNNIKGSSKVGGIVGENYGGIEHVYSTSEVQGYEYVGGIVGHQKYPGTIIESFYDEVADNECLQIEEDKDTPCYKISNSEADISKGALEIVGQDRKTREVMEGFEEAQENGESEEEHYNKLSEEEQERVDEAYKTDTQDWYISNTGNIPGTSVIRNVVVLSNEEYTQYDKYTSKSSGKQKGIIPGPEDLLMGGFKMIIKRIVDEQTEDMVYGISINVLSYLDFFHGLESYYDFSTEIWDLENIEAGTSEPIKLK
ncbi:MAG: hypothetical protein ACK5HR_06995 [Mycoplasmatales bacterium]